MINSRLSIVAAGAALAIGMIGSANALTITAGNYKIIFDNYDSGTLYDNPSVYPPPTGLKCGGTTNTAPNVSSCDGAAFLKAPGSVGSSMPSADSMGIFSVASITNLSTGTTQYVRGTASTIGGVAVGPYLTGVFGGITDFGVATNSDGLGGYTTTAYAGGGRIRVWSNTSDWDPTTGPTLGGDLNALQYLPSISGGSLFLDGAFSAGAAVFGNADASYVSRFSPNTIDGSGSGYIDWTAGSAYSFFNTNSVVNLNGGLNDAVMSVTYKPNADATANGWTVFSSGDVSGAVIPEPGSLALVALGLLGAGLITRRRRA